MQGILAKITQDCSATSGDAPVGTLEAFENTMIDGPYLKSADGSTMSGYTLLRLRWVDSRLLIAVQVG